MHEKNGRSSRPGLSWSKVVLLLALLGGSAMGLTQLNHDGAAHADIGVISGAPVQSPSQVEASAWKPLQISATPLPPSQALRLRGVAIWRANDPTAALALLDNGGDSALFAVGESIAQGFRLKRIETDRVVIEGADGRLVTIPLQWAATGTGVPLALASSAHGPGRMLPVAGPGTARTPIDESRVEPAAESNSD